MLLCVVCHLRQYGRIIVYGVAKSQEPYPVQWVIRGNKFMGCAASYRVGFWDEKIPRSRNFMIILWGSRTSGLLKSRKTQVRLYYIVQIFDKLHWLPWVFSASISISPVRFSLWEVNLSPKPMWCTSKAQIPQNTAHHNISPRAAENYCLLEPGAIIPPLVRYTQPHMATIALPYLAPPPSIKICGWRWEF